MPPRPERPADADYYERDRVELFSQGDIFRDVPLAYPLPADELVVDEEHDGSRRFVSGPLEFGPAMLITPSCSLGAQGAEGYAHPVRTLVPVLPLAELVERAVVKETALDDLRRFDHLINYMYLPPLEVDDLKFSMPERVAFLYMPLTLHPRVPRGATRLAACVPRCPAAAAEARLVLLRVARGRSRSLRAADGLTRRSARAR
jgi:hypothetical protein